MAKRSLEVKNEEEEEEGQEEEEEEEEEEEDDDDDEEYGDDNEDDGDDGVEEEVEDRSKRVMIRVVSSGQRRGALPVNCSNTLCCQADDCGVDLIVAKRYHRRHKVCERHAKAAVVLVGGIHQRFCQQCSRFHEISEFDDTKRSCRTRLAGHNERRRKTHPDLQAEVGQKPPSSQMNGCSFKATSHPDYAETDFRGRSNIKHFRIR